MEGKNPLIQHIYSPLTTVYKIKCHFIKLLHLIFCGSTRKTHTTDCRCVNDI